MVVRTLVVEDDPMLAQILLRFVQRVEGFSAIGKAHSCTEALRLSETMQPDLILLDVYLDGSGMDVLKDIRKKELPCDVIMVTAAHDAATVAAGMRYGAVDYIVKPFEFARLKAALENYARIRLRLETQQFSSQIEIDKLKAQLHKGPDDALPKNIDPLTLSKVIEVLPPFGKNATAGDVAIASGVSYGTAKRYLHFLTEKGELIKTLKYTTRGRPVVEYSPVDLGG